VALAAAPHRFTTDEYARLGPALDGRRTELVAGQVIDMPPIGTAHLLVVTRLQNLLVPALPGRVLVQQPLRIPDFDEPQPDLLVLRAPLGLAKPTPADCLLAVEVADSSYPRDRDVKVPLYLAAGIPRVWLLVIADHALPRLETYSSEEPSLLLGGPAPLGIGGVALVDLDALFAGLASLPADER
jgi:Uma2 family endonuclease